jgi:6-phosphogluconolactonase
MTPPLPAALTGMHRFGTPDEQACALAAQVAAQLTQAVAQRGRAALAVSGGRSPIVFFEHLRRHHLPWAQVVVTMVDERCVPAGHSERNAQLVREHLLQGQATQCTFVDWLAGIEEPVQLTPSALVAHAHGQMSGLPWPLDVAVLGMGEDGHTASWFADSPGLPEALHNKERVAWVRPIAAPHLRLTLTCHALQSCHHTHLAIAGSRKQDVLARALNHPQCGLPIQHLLQHLPMLQIWVTD